MRVAVDQLGDAARQQAALDPVEPGRGDHGQHLVRRRQVGHRARQVAVGRRSRTATRRSTGPPCRSTPRGPSAARDGAGWPPRAGRCAPRVARSRASSSKKGARSTRLRRAKPQVIPSTAPSRTGRRSASPWTRGAVVRAAASIPNDRSTPSGIRPDACSSRHRSPVPQARSSTAEPGRRVRDRTVSRRQRTSSRNVMMRLTRSYRGAMASNMERTAVAFSSPGAASPAS